MEKLNNWILNKNYGAIVLAMDIIKDFKRYNKRIAKLLDNIIGDTKVLKEHYKAINSWLANLSINENESTIANLILVLKNNLKNILTK